METEHLRLRQLAFWYREQAERAGNPVIWDARLRTAEDLEAEADRIEAGLSGASHTAVDRGINRRAA